MYSRFAAAVLAANALLFSGGVSIRPAEAQEPPVLAAQSLPADDAAASATGPRPGAAAGREWVFAPIPTYDPSQGWGLQLIVEYLIGASELSQQKSTEDESARTQTSVLALGGFYTQHDSGGAFAAYSGHLAGDRWRPALALGSVRVNYDFYGVGTALADIGLHIPVTQRVDFGLAQLSVRTWKSLYAGVRATAAKLDIAVQPPEGSPVSLPAFDKNVHSNSAGPMLQWDTRDNQFFPRAGSLIEARAMFTGGDFGYETYSAAWNDYFSLKTRDTVLAARAWITATGGDVPFYALPQFGMHSDLRGYQTGKFRDRSLVALQAEYRRMLGERWGLAVFAGAGEVAPALTRLNTDDILPSAGAGARWRLARTHPINLRLDYAYGKDGGTLYLSVGEAF
ncbi:MAG TPA: BamA/TamA family outer membrane protein [Steroidobacteraceae bacterium]|jgi:outer membrane protein assembly factor BamA